jgi:hypothetical protein
MSDEQKPPQDMCGLCYHNLQDNNHGFDQKVVVQFENRGL